MNVLARRPAETAGAALSAAALVGRLLGLDDSTVLDLAVLIGFVPAGVTWVVELRRKPKRKRRRRSQKGHGEYTVVVVVLVVLLVAVLLGRL